MTKRIKPFWGCDLHYEYGMILVFAESRQEAKQLTYKHFPNPDIEYFDVRVRLADKKWMKFYDPVFPYKDSYDGDYETWDQYWENEIE